MCLHILHSYHTLSFFLFSHFKFFSFLCHSFHLPNLQNQISSKPIFQKLWIGVSSQMIIFENKSSDGLMSHVETTLFMDICYLMWKSNDAYYQQKICWNPLLIPLSFLNRTFIAHNYLWIWYFTRTTMAIILICDFGGDWNLKNLQSMEQ